MKNKVLYAMLMTMKYPAHLKILIDTLRRLPGVGTKSAERFAFQLLEWPEAHLEEFAYTIKNISEKLKNCIDCGCLIGLEDCSFCDTARRDPQVICVIASPKDAFAIEETREYKGLYHVLGGVLSPMDGIGPEKLTIHQLKERVTALNSKELIIALDSTLEGDATALFIKQEFEPFDLKISRLAFGLPMGSALDYVDGGTLGRAFVGRNSF